MATKNSNQTNDLLLFLLFVIFTIQIVQSFHKKFALSDGLRTVKSLKITPLKDYLASASASSHSTQAAIVNYGQVHTLPYKNNAKIENQLKLFRIDNDHRLFIIDKSVRSASDLEAHLSLFPLSSSAFTFKCIFLVEF